MERPNFARVPIAGTELRTDALIAAMQVPALADVSLEGWLDRIEWKR